MSSDHKGQVEQTLKDIGKKIDNLIFEAKNTKDEVQDDVEDKINELKIKKNKLEEDYQNFKVENEDKWEEIKNHLAGAAEEIKLAAEAAFKKKE